MTSCPATCRIQSPGGPGGADIIIATQETEAGERVYLDLQFEGTHEGREGMGAEAGVTSYAISVVNNRKQLDYKILRSCPSELPPARTYLLQVPQLRKQQRSLRN